MDLLEKMKAKLAEGGTSTTGESIEKIIPVKLAAEPEPAKKRPLLKKALIKKTLEPKTALMKKKEEQTTKPEMSAKSEYIGGYIMLMTGYESSGKTAQALTFPTPFLIGTEKKIFAMMKNPPIIAPEVGDMIMNQDYVYVTAYIGNDIRKGIDYIKTYANIKYWCNWFMDEGYKTHDTMIFDVIKAFWDAAWGAAEQKKGKQLGKPEFIPITQEIKSWFIPFMDWCDEMGKNLIMISHTTGKYIDVDKYNSIMVGEVPDAKYWIRELVSWRIDLQSPEQLNWEFGNDFIAYFAKAPGQQNYQIDLTGKRLFDILKDPLMLDAERESLRMRIKKKKLKAKKEAKKA